jgi:hypothetical protein
MKQKSASWTTWEDMPIEEFLARAQIAKQKAAAFVNDIHELFPGLVTLTREQRQSAPRLRDGEHGMFTRVLDVVDRKPALFESLADEDEGMDPSKFETPLLRGRIQKHATFNELDDTLIPLASQMGDTSLYLASKFKDACLSAYRISKAHAATDKVVNDILAPVIDYMRKSALAAAATRAANKTDPEKKKS